MSFKTIITTTLMAAAAGWTFAASGLRIIPRPVPPFTAPLATPMTPADATVNLPLNTPVAATFSQPMDPATINTLTFTLQQRGMPVFGAVAYDGSTATFTPAALLAPLTVYTAMLTTGVRSAAGVSLSGDVAWNFTTGPGGVLSPQLPVNLGTAGNFTVLAASAITNTSVTTLINGNIGLSPTSGTAITGVLQSNVSGTIYTVDGLGPAGNVMDPAGLTLAQNDLTVAYNDAALRVTPDATNPGAGNLGGLTLAPGLYKFDSSAGLSGANLTLSGPSTGVWIFQIASTLTVGSGMRVTLSGGATASNVFWQVGSSATMGTTAHMEGTIMANISITFQTGATLNGRALARTGAVTLDNFNGGSPSTCTTSNPTASLSATANTGTNSIDLGWSAVAGATAYKVFRSTQSGGPYTLINTVLAPATAYSDAAVIGGVWYYYVIRAVNLCDSVDSPQAAASLPNSCLTAAAPATASATANLSPRGIDLSWGAVSGATGYRIYRATTSGGPYTLINSVASPATTYSDATILNNVVYYYVVRAFNLCESGNSPEASAALVSSCAAAAPGALTAVVSPAKSGINLSWTAVSGATGYQILRSTASAGPYVQIATVNAPATTYADTTVLNDWIWYFYVIRTVNGCASGNSPWSSAMRAGC